MLKAYCSAFKKYHAFISSLEPKEVFFYGLSIIAEVVLIFILRFVIIFLSVRADPELKMILMGG